MEVSSLKILFKENGKPIESRVVTTCVRDFGNSYNETVREIIVTTPINCCRPDANKKAEPKLRRVV